MLGTLRKILDLVSATERRRAALLLGMILLSALFDTVGVASIIPFMSVLANPELVTSNRYLAWLYEAGDYQDPHAFLTFTGVLVFLVFVLSTAFRGLTTYTQLRFTLMREYSLGRRLVSGYLHQPYEWFLNRHSADLGKTVLSEVTLVTYFAMIPMMDVIAYSILVLALLVLLVLADPALALTVFGVLGTAYGLIYGMLRGYVGRLGAERVEANTYRFESVSEAFGGIKDVKIAGLEHFFLNRFDTPAQKYARHQTGAQLASQIPRFVLEAVAFGGMLLVVLYLMRASGSIETALPVLTLYALAAYRLMPALQRIYAGLSSIRYAEAAVNSLHAEMQLLSAPRAPASSQPPMRLEHSICLNAVSYAFPNTASPALHELSLEIPARSSVGLVGATGSGKTTTVDIIMGLLWPQAGTLEVDGVAITPDNVHAWQRCIGYVPQLIYLTDDTIMANIAFGIPADRVDTAAVERAAVIANLHEFVTEELPQGYQTKVGERGVRLSGGQRQRIGLARALYHSPQVLILDEATSALDNLTEQQVMDAVQKLGLDITIIIIAHRLSTVRNCDKIYVLESGRVSGSGTLETLRAENQRFRSMEDIATIAR